jgi:hypothetical protein
MTAQSEFGRDEGIVSPACQFATAVRRYPAAVDLRRQTWVIGTVAVW